MAQSDQTSLGDAARRARAEKKDAPKNAKVFTNDDVGSLKGTINVVGPDPTPAADTSNPAAAKVASAAPGGAGKGEAYFRDKFAAARRALADDSRELDVLQREFGLKQTQYYSDPNVAMREQYGREDLNKTQAGIDTKKPMWLRTSKPSPISKMNCAALAATPLGRTPRKLPLQRAIPPTRPARQTTSWKTIPPRAALHRTQRRNRLRPRGTLLNRIHFPVFALNLFQSSHIRVSPRSTPARFVVELQMAPTISWNPYF